MTPTVIQQILDVVNEAISDDPSAMRALFENRVPCNERLANHPSIQVMMESEEVGNTVGILGLLSGIAGTREYRGNKTFSRIWAVYNVNCPVHGNIDDNENFLVGETCPEDDCEEKLVLGDLLRVEQVPEKSDG